MPENKNIYKFEVGFIICPHNQSVSKKYVIYNTFEDCIYNMVETSENAYKLCRKLNNDPLYPTSNFKSLEPED